MRISSWQVLAVWVVLAGAVAEAAPAAHAHLTIREGANHHVGDDSFVARFGRQPDEGDSEALRMRVHLEYVHDLLAARAATRPELAPRRTELLGYLADYIAKGTTPQNSYVPWRSPVFIDRAGQICAVGYLIERSVGRALPEAIARRHRLAYLEDIAAAEPEVVAWVERSGFTLEELASIQPGYEGPEVMHAHGWELAKVTDGPYTLDQDGTTLTGRFANKQMTGTWVRRISAPAVRANEPVAAPLGEPGKVIGIGKLRGGDGTWTSLRPDGTKLATGPFIGSHAEGTWQVFYPSGRLAATGRMHRGQRHGAWKLFRDVPGGVLLAAGRFERGEVMGGWKHYDPAGKLLAVATGQAWSGLSLEILPGPDGVRREVHQGVPADAARLDAFTLGKERLYLLDRGTLYDARGASLQKVSGAWRAQSCAWPAKLRRELRAGNGFAVFWSLDGHYEGERPTITCTGEAQPVPAARAAQIETMLASRSQVRAPRPVVELSAPELVVDGIVGGDDDVATAEPPAEDDPTATAFGVDRPDDLTTYLIEHMTWYFEWPHVDETFVALYATLPGYGTRE